MGLNLLGGIIQAALDDIAQEDTTSPEVATQVQKELGVVLKVASNLAASSCTRDSRQHAIISQSGDFKAGLQALLSAARKGREGERGGAGGKLEESLELTRRYSASLKQEVGTVEWRNAHVLQCCCCLLLLS